MQDRTGQIKITSAKTLHFLFRSFLSRVPRETFLPQHLNPSLVSVDPLESLQDLVGVGQSDLSRVGLDRDQLDDTILDDNRAALQAGSAKDGLSVQDEAGGVCESATVVGGYWSATIVLFLPRY